MNIKSDAHKEADRLARDAEIAADVRRVISIAIRMLRESKSNLKYVSDAHLREVLRLEIQELEIP